MATYRLCLTGPECTGKTQLATEMAARYGTIFVPEYAREYAVENPRVLTAADVEPIARGQVAITESASESSRRLLLLDTDLISTVVYARYYYDSCPAWIEEEARRRRADRYLLLDVDTPWDHDGVRDTGQDRERLFASFERTLAEFGADVEPVSGDWSHRREQTIATIDALLRGA